MSIPNVYPEYIKNIPNAAQKSSWEKSYREAYTKEYNQYNSEWNDLKAIMSSVALFALTLFPSIILIAKATAVTVAASLSIFSVGTAGSVCLGLYYGIYLTEHNKSHLSSMPTNFPIKFKATFDKG
jgi:hypothetical protein